MESWCADHGVSFFPHFKHTMYTRTDFMLHWPHHTDTLSCQNDFRDWEFCTFSGILFQLGNLDNARIFLNIYICPLSSVQNKLRFILHEPYDLSWPLSGWSLGQNRYYCASSIYFLKRKTNPTRYHIYYLVLYLGWLIRSLSCIIIVPTLK